MLILKNADIFTLAFIWLQTIWSTLFHSCSSGLQQIPKKHLNSKAINTYETFKHWGYKQQNLSGVILYLSSCKHIFVAFFCFKIFHIFPTGDGSGLQAGLYNVVLFCFVEKCIDVVLLVADNSLDGVFVFGSEHTVSMSSKKRSGIPIVVTRTCFHRHRSACSKI